MTTEQGLIFLTMGASLALFAWGKIRYDIIAMMAMFSVVIIGAIEPNDALACFGHPAVITVAAVLVISRGLQNSGVVDLLAQQINPFTYRATTHVGMLTGVVTALSAFMNNVGALALMMPVTLTTAAKRGRPASVLLMPLAFGSILGGLMTMIGTPPNIIISVYREEIGRGPFAMFDYMPVGGVVALVGVVYISAVGWRFVPWKQRASKRASKLFEINEYISQVKITENSRLIGGELGLAEELSTDELVIVGLVRGESKVMHPRRSHILEENDILIIRSDPKRLKEVINKYGLKVVTASGYTLDELESANVRIAELVVAADSPLVGRTAVALRKMTLEGVSLLALAHRGTPLRSRLRQRRFDSGDMILVQGDNQALDDAINELRLIPLAERDVNIGRPNRIKRAVTIFSLSIFASAMGWLPAAFAFGLAIIGYIATGLIAVRNLYKDIEWPVIVLIAGMIPVGYSFENSGCADLVANGMLNLTDGWPPWLILGALMMLTMLLSDIINNSATALVMAPLGYKIAEGLQVNVDAFLMGVAVAASCAFLTPIGHQSNTLVMGPGGYNFKDYWRMGLPLDFIIVIVGVFMISKVWPL